MQKPIHKKIEFIEAPAQGSDGSPWYNMGVSVIERVEKGEREREREREREIDRVGERLREREKEREREREHIEMEKEREKERERESCHRGLPLPRSDVTHIDMCRNHDAGSTR